MKYKLAKQLKDANFPILYGYKEYETMYSGDYEYAKRKVKSGNVFDRFDGCFCDIVPVPTLSNLIKACGKDFNNLSYYNNNYWAVTHSKFDNNGNNYETCGRTPEDAVAELWLKINTNHETN